MSLNQVVLVGKLLSLRETVVDNGTFAVVLSLSIDKEFLDVWARDELAGDISMHCVEGSFLAVKGRLHQASDGLTIIAERVSMLSLKGDTDGDA